MTIVRLRITAGVIKAIGVPAIVVAILIIYPDSSSLTVSGGLRPAAMLGRIDGERGQQQEQHGGYCGLPVCPHVQHSYVSGYTMPFRLQRPTSLRLHSRTAGCKKQLGSRSISNVDV